MSVLTDRIERGRKKRAKHGITSRSMHVSGGSLSSSRKARGHETRKIEFILDRAVFVLLVFKVR